MTLIEVLLAVAILGASLVGLLAAASRCLAVLKVAREYETAQWTLGLGEADYPLVTTGRLEELEVPGETYPNGYTFVREIEEDTDEDGLHVVRTRVVWGIREAQRVEEVVGYLLHPEEEDE